jgi:hypothetical protein
MITRRSFLIGAGALLTADLVTRFEWHIRNHGEPLVLAPERPDTILHVDPDRSYEVTLGSWDDILDLTNREVLEDYCGLDLEKSKLKLSDYHRIREEYGIAPKELDEPVSWDLATEGLPRSATPNGAAYSLLRGLDIGPDLHSPGRLVGGLDFFDGPMPGNDYLGVCCRDEISVSLLQARLNELGENIAVHVG